MAKDDLGSTRREALELARPIIAGWVGRNRLEIKGIKSEKDWGEEGIHERETQRKEICCP